MDIFRLMFNQHQSTSDTKIAHCQSLTRALLLYLISVEFTVREVIISVKQGKVTCMAQANLPGLSKIVPS